ncbi:juvenile hormone esterase-like [Dendroctonus ponderosae]|uniref:juvenile hormone esterase-like n=1 Tax=Dendroctonus ponderosae TaxID=77166 RepID=UPI002035523B|nr:juvenile hormone esterase-like [Dendroctonus ponderosae]
MHLSGTNFQSLNMWPVLACVLFTLLSQCSAEDLIVTIANGKVQGTSYTSANGTSFYTWRHIPYAQPPVGDLRFLAPEAPDNWTDILNGTEDSPACWSVGTFAGTPDPTHGQSEDCLYINVYSSSPMADDTLRPVMFWIYGGGFFAGNSDFDYYDPTPFLEEDVIVVTFNYRLNVFGFLSTEDQIVPGNAALKDQLMALKWTKTNIAFFGGNPQNITIFGQSAGAMSVGYHLVSLKSRDLFSGAILESGSALRDYFQSNANKNALAVASQINSSISTTSSSQNILSILQAVDAEKLVTIAKEIQSKEILDVAQYRTLKKCRIFSTFQPARFILRLIT